MSGEGTAWNEEEMDVLMEYRIRFAARGCAEVTVDSGVSTLPFRFIPASEVCRSRP